MKKLLILIGMLLILQLNAIAQEPLSTSFICSKGSYDSLSKLTKKERIVTYVQSTGHIEVVFQRSPLEPGVILISYLVEGKATVGGTIAVPTGGSSVVKLCVSTGANMDEGKLDAIAQSIHSAIGHWDKPNIGIMSVATASA